MGDKLHAGAVLVPDPVPRIAENGMAEHDKVAANLMQTSSLEGDFKHLRVHGGVPFATTHALLRQEVERKGEQSYGSFRALRIILGAGCKR